MNDFAWNKAIQEMYCKDAEEENFDSIEETCLGVRLLILKEISRLKDDTFTATNNSWVIHNLEKYARLLKVK